MAKVIKYKFLAGEVTHETEDGSWVEKIFLDHVIGWSETNEQIAKREAYNGEYIIEDDGRQKSAAEQIAELKKLLSATDYKVIKCAECQLLGQEMPYDVAALHAERQAIRDQINRLEQEE